MTLYELTAEFRQLLDLAEDPEIDEAVFSDTLEALTGEIEDKAEGYAIVIKELESNRDKFKSEAKRMSETADTFDHRIKRMKSNLLVAMDVIGVRKVQTEHFTVSQVGNGGKKPLAITGDVPEEYKVFKPETDTQKIRDALEAGQELPFAHLEERGTHLSIR